ncbi:hypothetical protein NUSPORA_00210 [Nucleospora cyclopteri]
MLFNFIFQVKCKEYLDFVFQILLNDDLFLSADEFDVGLLSRKEIEIKNYSPRFTYNFGLFQTGRNFLCSNADNLSVCPLANRGLELEETKTLNLYRIKNKNRLCLTFINGPLNNPTRSLKFKVCDMYGQRKDQLFKMIPYDEWKLPDPIPKEESSSSDDDSSIEKENEITIKKTFKMTDW